MFLTRDILVQYVVLLDHIVQQSFAPLVQDEYLPLCNCELGLQDGGAQILTSPRVVDLSVWIST